MCKHTHTPEKKQSQLRGRLQPFDPIPFLTKMEKPSSPLHMQTWEKKSQLRTVAPCPQVLSHVSSKARDFHHTKKNPNSLKTPIWPPQTLAPGSNRIAAIIEPGRSLSLHTALVLEVALMLAPSPFKAMAVSIIQEAAAFTHFSLQIQLFHQNPWEYTDYIGILPPCKNTSPWLR